MTRIKCCGMTRVEDARLAAHLGADAIGLVFASGSRRCVSIEQAQCIVRALPPLVSTVALFMDARAADVQAVIMAVQPHFLQFHGVEADLWCAQFGRPFIKTVAMGEGASALRHLRDFPHATALLLDGHASGEAGGSGKTFDWAAVPAQLDQPLMLAGGLDADNVECAIRLTRPWAVDVASGIEASPGIKDAVKMKRFIDAVRRAPADSAERVR